MAIVLIGFMGAGKSTVAAELGAALRRPVFDSDELLAQRFGHPVAREFELRGEQAFRAAEEELVSEMLAAAPAEAVIALGGGSVLSARVRDALAAHRTVLLDVEAEQAWQRVTADGSGAARPLASDRAGFFALHAERAALYEELADAVLVGLDVGGAAAAAAALGLLDDSPAGTRLLWASADSGSYPVLVGAGLLSPGLLARVAQAVPSLGGGTHLIADAAALELYGGGLGPVDSTFSIEPGEASKTLAVAQQVWEALAARGATRADHLVALGGGVAGDLAGFCAATYQRGVPVVQVPTTVVAQVDSAYGGKTGVDLPQAKNYVGAYHQPAAVLVDPETLATLPPQELAAGWVEVLKTALIAGGPLWEHLAAGGEADAATIFACARTKLATVAADERDGGRRQVLNLGHTVGHAIETVTGYARYRHGEAVGLGLLATLRLSGQTELRARVRELLAERGLPVSLQDADVDAVLEAIRRDKKRIGADVPFVLVSAPGEVEFGCAVPGEELRAAVAELAA